MDDNEIYVVEVLIKDNWHPAYSSMDENLAKARYDEIVNQGVKKDEIRITKSKFAFNRKWSGD